LALDLTADATEPSLSTFFRRSNGRTRAEPAVPVTGSDPVVLDTRLNLPRTQLKALAEMMSSVTLSRILGSGCFRTHTTLASPERTQRARLCRLISETIDSVSPMQHTT
jgi:hypothetical protein